MDAPDPSIDGPLSRDQARSLLDAAAARMAAGEFADAARAYARVVGHRDADVTGAALLGLGEARYRLDLEDEAVASWEAVLRLPPNPATYAAWRNVAAARVRAGNLRGAMDAYREADRLAPPEDRPEIASRLGWLSKELGDAGASRRWFARARGDAGTPVTIGLIGLTTIVSVVCFLPQGEALLLPWLWLDKAAVADGEYWRLLTVTLVHGGILHLLFNMYALWIAGPIVERFYGSGMFLLLYLLCAAAGSVASFVFGGDGPSVGASGAVFGLFGVLLAVSRVHVPLTDRRTRAVLAQLGPIVLLNLAFGFFFPNIDNAAHIGGLVAGLWLGWLLVPGRIGTLAGAWQNRQAGGWRTSAALRTVGVLALVVAIAAGVVVGTEARGGSGPNGILASASVATSNASPGAART